MAIAMACICWTRYVSRDVSSTAPNPTGCVSDSGSGIFSNFRFRISVALLTERQIQQTSRADTDNPQRNCFLYAAAYRQRNGGLVLRNRGNVGLSRRHV